MSHACHRFWKCYKTLTFCSLLARCRIPCTCQAKSHIWTFKSDPSIWCFVHFDLEMCFAPQRRPLFRHRNFRKCSEVGVLCTFWLGNVLWATAASTFWHRNFQRCSDVGVLCTFWLGNVLLATAASTFRHRNFQRCSDVGVLCTFWLGNALRATAASTFSTSQLPKVLRRWCVLCVVLTSCFTAQRRALILHLNFQKCSEREVLSTFWLGVFEAARILSVRRLSKSHQRHHLPRPWQLFGWEKEPPASSAWGVKRSALQSMKSYEIIWNSTKNKLILSVNWWFPQLQNFCSLPLGWGLWSRCHEPGSLLCEHRHGPGSLPQQPLKTPNDLGDTQFFLAISSCLLTI